MFHPILFGSASHKNPFEVFEDLFGMLEAAPRVSGLDAYEEDGRLTIRMDLPGYEKGKISVAAENGLLTISADATSEDEERKDRKYLVRSTARRSFKQTLVVPSGYDESKTDASYEAGVLSVSLPRKEQPSRGRRIEIK